MKTTSANDFGRFVAAAPKSSPSTVQTLAVVTALILASLFSGWMLAGGTALNLNVPLSYTGDGLLIESFIKRLIDNPWINFASQMGAPFGSYLYDYPIPDSGSLFALKVIGKAFGSAGIAFNLYYLIGFPLNALASYFVMRRMGISQLFSFTGAMVFTLLPFHTMRIAHLFYTWYFVVPLFVWYSHRIYVGKLNFFKKGDFVQRCLDIAGLLILSCFGVYYSFFGVLTLLTAGAIVFLQTGRTKALIASVVATVVVSAGIVANVAPNLNYRALNGVNQESAQRSPAEAEMYGLKIAQLVLPRPGHRSSKLARINAAYSTTFPLVNENSTSSLGIIGVVGFLFLLITPFFPRKNDCLLNTTAFFLAAITFVLLIFSTIGGFSAVFNLLVTPMIRAWNRVSVFIGFTSITAVMLLVQYMWLRRNEGSGFKSIASASLLLVVAFWDQTSPACKSCLISEQATYRIDANFVHSIEAYMPQNSVIYQLPFFPFPESVYTQLKGYIHSRHLRWSFGAIRGREGSQFFSSLAEQPIHEQIRVARNAGFSGVYLDLLDYPDHGAGAIAAFTNELKAPPKFISENGQEAFYDLRESAQPIASLPSGLPPRQIVKHADFLGDPLGPLYSATLTEGIVFSRPGAPSFVAALDGFSGKESWGRWSDANVDRDVTLTFRQPLPARFILHIVAKGFGSNAGAPCRVVIGNQTRNFVPASGAAEYALPFDNVAAANTIVIQPSKPESPSSLGISDDGRRLGVGLVRLWIETQKALG